MSNPEIAVDQPSISKCFCLNKFITKLLPIVYNLLTYIVPFSAPNNTARKVIFLFLYEVTEIKKSY